MSEAVIKVRDLSKVYELGEISVHALRVSAWISTGEMVAIMGPSGSQIDLNEYDRLP